MNQTKQETPRTGFNVNYIRKQKVKTKFKKK